MKSISDDDLCSDCTRCSYIPGDLSGCSLGFPGITDLDGYIVHCAYVRHREAGTKHQSGLDVTCCDECGVELEEGQVGLCEDCQDEKEYQQ